MNSPFQVIGNLAVAESATVICLRNVGVCSNSLRREQLLPPTPSIPGQSASEGQSAIERIFGGAEEIDLSSGWEVLMGQNECINWVRSKAPDNLALMRYPGEYKFAGGNLDDGEDFIVAACRELEEEFLSPIGLSLPTDAVVRPFVFKQTLPVRSKSNIMWNMVALASENPWLQHLDVREANRCLQERRESFEELLASGRFWQLNLEEREAVAPEVRELCWLPLSEALFYSLGTMVAGGRHSYVNYWQQSEFARLNIRSRDPMFMTACALMDVAAFPDVKSMTHYCTETFHDESCMASERARLQYLFPGMTSEEVQHRRFSEPSEFIKDAPTILRLRAERKRQREQIASDRANMSRIAAARL